MSQGALTATRALPSTGTKPRWLGWEPLPGPEPLSSVHVLMSWGINQKPGERFPSPVSSKLRK